MFNPKDVQRTCPKTCSLEEWQLRLQLAACYRVFDHKGWSEEIFNHITVEVPGPEKQYLINPFGLTYAEVTASNLVKIDLAGNPAHPTEYAVNRAGFIIHSAIHAARHDAQCVMHTHNSYGLAVACKEGGLALDNFYAAFLHDKLAYHDFEGVTVHQGEQQRMVRNLDGKTCLVLRNHGLLVADQTIASAYFWMYTLQRACEIQVLSGAIPGRNIPLTAEACAVSARDATKTDPQSNLYNKVFEAAARRAGITVDQIV
jgi:ribulose-5-phosphate 4-epimerase/fuculose-1-phosphate aldolase